MRKPATIGVLLLVGLGLSQDARAAGKVKLILNGTFGLETLRFSDTRAVSEFLEEGALSSEYSVDPAPGAEVGLQVTLVGSFGLRASYSVATRDQTVSYSATLPHPLYFDSDRSVTGDVPGLAYEESAARLGLIYGGGKGSLEYSAFVGFGRFWVEADMIDEIHYTDSYPYDTVTVQSVPSTTVKDSPIGFDAGLSLDWVFSQHFGLGAQLRYSRARAKLTPAGGETIEIDVGGPELAAGLRIIF